MSKLRYDAAPPPFLAALRAQAATDAGSGPDPQASARRRVAQKRSASEEAEDEPLVVDERGYAVDVSSHAVDIDHDATLAPEAVSSSSFTAIASSSTSTAAATSSSSSTTAAASARPKQEKPTVGPRKRRTGRLVGQEAVPASSEPAPPSKPKKKQTKKIKLSFDPDQS